MKDKITEYFRKKWRYIVAICILFVFLVFFRETFFIGLMFILTILLGILAKKTKIKMFGIELVTFSTVSIGYIYGPVWGALSGMGLELINSFIVGRMTRTYNFWVIPSFGLAGVIAGLGLGIPFIMLGIGISIGLHVVYAGMSLILKGRLHPKYIIYAIPNIIFNILIFTGIGNTIIGLMG